MAATTILLTTVAASNASAVAASGSAAPAVWMLIMLVAIVPWALYIYSDEVALSHNGMEKMTNANIALALYGVISMAIVMFVYYK